MALRIETKFVRAKDANAVAVRYTNDPNAPAVSVREEDVLKNYPMTYGDLTDILRRRYSNFVVNREYHELRRILQQDRKYSIERILNPGNPRSARQQFFNSNIIQEFDKHYQLKSKPSAAAAAKAVAAPLAPAGA